MRTDNGPELTNRIFIAWTQEHHIRHILIEPGRPLQNGYIESFNGKFRDECLNEHWFETLQFSWYTGRGQATDTEAYPDKIAK